VLPLKRPLQRLPVACEQPGLQMAKGLSSSAIGGQRRGKNIRKIVTPTAPEEHWTPDSNSSAG
jgi:hypothetical protein